MSGTALDNPLVREYLRELETAFARLPAGQASELREQITAHITDALPRDASDEQVAAVLDRLGLPSELAAEAVAGATVDAPRGNAADRPRERAPRIWRNRWFWLAAAAIVAVIAVVATNLISAEAAPVLAVDGSSGWWYPQDSARQVDTSADGAEQTTVPIRSGQWQGFFVELFNESGQTQTVLGPAYGNGLPTAFVGASPPQGVISVSAPNREVDEGSDIFKGVRFALPGVIPAHQLRFLRVLWRSTTCLLAGGASGNDELALRVRVGWITRTEVISLGQGWFVAGPSTGKYADSGPYCQR